ncbi:MAG: stage II sporulation protein M [Anaerolineaceae bacterium]|jgi:uncharacterized membrane protein SpoIIM required for sporulation/ABC-type transport system involved in multi-copper enzyme maturation permease subunit
MLDALRPALVITRREIRDQFRDWRIFFPAFGLTLFFPTLMNFTARQLLNFVEQYGANIINERLVPFFLLIVGFFPISVSLVIALESFVGEKERGSIEPLLNSPLKDWQLYLGKLLAVVVPPLLYSYIGMGVYLLGLYRQGVVLPHFSLLLQIFMLTTVQAVMMVSGAVVVSTQATSVRSANLLASFIVIPTALLIQGESVIMFWGDYSTLWWVVFGIFVLSVLLVRVGLAHFQREELLGRELDVLNIRWIWGVLRSSFTGDTRSVKQWYIHIFRQAIPGMKKSILVILLIMAVGIWIGYTQVERLSMPWLATSGDEVMLRVQSLVQVLPSLGFTPVGLILWQNIRVLLISLVAGVCTLGILGVIPLIATMGMVGFLAGVMQAQGYSNLVFAGLVLPHGIFELPAAALATAAVLHTGVLLATPTPGKTIGEAWLSALANWFKIMVGIVMPLLIIGAMVEVWITPQIALILLR